MAVGESIVDISGSSCLHREEGPNFYRPDTYVTARRVAPAHRGGKGHSHLCQSYLMSSSSFLLLQI